MLASPVVKLSEASAWYYAWIWTVYHRIHLRIVSHINTYLRKEIEREEKLRSTNKNSDHADITGQTFRPSDFHKLCNSSAQLRSFGSDILDSNFGLQSNINHIILPFWQ